MENKNLSFFNEIDEKKKINTIHILKDGEEEDLSIEKIFDKVGLNISQKQKVYELSGGEKQRNDR